MHALITEIQLTYISSIFITEFLVAVSVWTFWIYFHLLSSSYQLLSTRSAHSMATGQLDRVIEESIAVWAGVTIKVSIVLEDLSCG